MIANRSTPVRNVAIFRPLTVPAVKAAPAKPAARPRTLRWLARTTVVPYWLLGSLFLGMVGTTSLVIYQSRAVQPEVTVVQAPPKIVTVDRPVAGPAGPDAETLAQISGLEAQVSQLAADLERARRDASTLHGMTQQQSQDLARAQSELDAAEHERQAEIQDLQARIGNLEQQLSSVEQLAAKLRGLLGLSESPAATGGPPGVDPAVSNDPAAVAHTQIVQAEGRVAALQSMLVELDRAAEARLASVRAAGVATSGMSAADLAFSPNVPRGAPVQGPITSTFGYRDNPFVAGFAGSGQEPASELHTGMDISVPTGTPVKATGAGVVIIAGPYGGYGNLVVIDHGRGISTYYGHNSEVLVSVGQRVEAGQVIAHAGSTGRSTGPHVHYEVRINNVPVDPSPYMRLPG